MMDLITAMTTAEVGVTLLAAVAAFATGLTVLLPILARDQLPARMKLMALERAALSWP